MNTIGDIDRRRRIFTMARQVDNRGDLLDVARHPTQLHVATQHLLLRCQMGLSTWRRRYFGDIWFIRRGRGTHIGSISRGLIELVTASVQRASWDRRSSRRGTGSGRGCSGAAVEGAAATIGIALKQVLDVLHYERYCHSVIVAPWNYDVSVLLSRQTKFLKGRFHKPWTKTYILQCLAK